MFIRFKFPAFVALLCWLSLNSLPSKADEFNVENARNTVIKNNMADIAMIERLRSNSQQERISATRTVLSSPENATPPVLYHLANALYKDSRASEANFWYQIGKMRVSFDIRRNRDQSLADVPQVLAMQLDKALIQEVYFKDLESSLRIAKSAIEWDKNHSYNYNPLWPTPHGLGIFKPGEVGMTSERDWPAIIDDVHTQWLDVMMKNVEEAKARKVNP